eukprot:843599-Pelagomonas_calceolata.AAC.1
MLTKSGCVHNGRVPLLVGKLGPHQTFDGGAGGHEGLGEATAKAGPTPPTGAGGEAVGCNPAAAAAAVSVADAKGELWVGPRGAQGAAAG